MRLRYKFAMLAFFYVMTLAANVAMCSWCLFVYYQSFLGQAAADQAVDGVLPLEVERVHVGRILLVSALCGVALGVLGLRLVRRWVIEPIAALRDAAARIGQGDLSHPVQLRSRDEMGELAAEVRSMTSSIIRMQADAVEQERRQAAVQTLRCIVHNVRSPLTGIRWVAEAVGGRNDVDADTAREQGLIVQTVDETLGWLEGYRASLLGAQHLAHGKGDANPLTHVS